MVKLRNRILSTLLLAALSVTLLGTTAEAARRRARTPSSTPPRPVVSPNAGEPDLTGQTAPAPPKIERASSQPQPGNGDPKLQEWVRLWLSQFSKRRS